MEIRWANLVAAALVVCALYIVSKMHPQMRAFLSTMSAIGSGHELEEQVLGLIAVGLLSATLLAALRIVLQRDRDDRRDDR